MRRTLAFGDRNEGDDMRRNPSGETSRNLVFERMAVRRCTSVEAAQALQTDFDRTYKIAREAGLRRVENQRKKARGNKAWQLLKD